MYSILMVKQNCNIMKLSMQSELYDVYTKLYCVRRYETKQILSLCFAIIKEK